jgi:predicted Rossmann fold nucleotide-binding protein DprA/Smf involved in DNA uptake
MKVAIVGSRAYPNLSKVRAYIQSLPLDTIIVSGGARGVDKCAEKVAESIGLQTEIYPADWHKYGKAAGMKRNQQIVEASDRVVAFWDGESKGTKNTIDTAKKLGKEVTVFQ